MANFTFLDQNGSNLIANAIPYNWNSVTKLNVTRNSAPWIYSNYPEGIAENSALTENGYYINQQRIKGEAEIFFSHRNDTYKELRFRIHIFNCSASAVTVKRTNIGFTSGWGKADVAVRQYFSGDNKTFTLASGASNWLTDEYKIAARTTGSPLGLPFSGMVRLEASNDIIVTEYAYHAGVNFTGNEENFEYNGSQEYTGLGTGNFITFNHKLNNSDQTKVSALKLKPYIYTINHDQSARSNTNEIVPIKLVGTNLTADINSPTLSLRNLGNWCAHNYHIIKFTNDTNAQATIYEYISSNEGAGNTQVINRGGIIKSASLTSDTGKKQWRWCKLILNAGESYEFDFQQILASYGESASMMKWSLE